MPTRVATAVWEGGLQSGTGSFSGQSGKIGGAYSFGTRFGTTPDRRQPTTTGSIVANVSTTSAAPVSPMTRAAVPCSR